MADKMFEALSKSGNPAAPIADSTLRLTAKEWPSDGVEALTLEHPEGRRLPDWAPDAHIDLMLANGVTRQYSLCGDRWDPYTFRVGVLREPAGRGGSAFVQDSLDVGDLVGVGGPRNNFPLVPAPRYLFVADGRRNSGGRPGESPALWRRSVQQFRSTEFLGRTWGASGRRTG